MFGIIYLFIFMVFLKYAVERYDYLPCVGIYAVGRGLIPALLNFNGPVYLVIMTVVSFIIGLLFVKAFTIFTENVENYWAILGIGALIEFLISLGIGFAAATLIFH